MKKKEILDALVAFYSNGSKTEFAERLGITKSNLSLWYSRDYWDISKVFFACPGVSAEWLLTGEGEMLAENRQPAIKDGHTIPFIGRANLLTGKWEYEEWDTEDGYILEKGVALNCDFITKMPTSDLAHYFPPALLGCSNVYYRGNMECPEYQEGGLYIIKTLTGIFFVECMKKKYVDDRTVYTFTTNRNLRRMSGEATFGQDLVISLPESDILQSAEIVWHLEEHVLVNPK